MQLKTFASRECLIEALTDELERSFTRAAEADYAVILSGGNTPLPAYQRLAALSAPASPHLHLTLSDERMVPADDPRCNARYLKPVTAALQLPSNRFLPVNTAFPLEEAARAFDAGIRSWMQRSIVFELAVLGLGPDGHTASLFSADDVRRGTDACAISVRRPDPPDRVSLTPTVFSITRRILILAAGEEKAPMIQTLLHNPRSIPCGLAIQKAPSVELWTDQPVEKSF
ncbi:MAG: 6-phosphogluconolactonase [Kiritimatiellae bacterium]|nr:6-phosphogluconolactonase [Kiritimatiellia bacterium]